MVFLTASGVFLSDSLRKDAFMSETTFNPANSGFLVVNKPELPGAAEHSRQRWQVPGFVLRLLSPLLLLLLWELASQTGLLPVRVIAAPSQIGGTLWSMIVSGELAVHLWVSLQRALLGLSIGVSLVWSRRC